MIRGRFRICLLTTALAIFSAAAGELEIAKAALRDGLWEVARAHAESLVGEAPRLVVLESYAGQGDWKGLAAKLATWPDAKGDPFEYYRCVLRGDHAAAMAILRRAGSAAGLVEVKLYEASALATAGKRTEAEALWRGLAADTNVSDRVLAACAMNLGDEPLLARACERVQSAALRQRLTVRLGVAKLKAEATAAEGEKLIRAIAKGAPDTEGVREAFIALCDRAVAKTNYLAAASAYHELLEIWPDAARNAAVQEGRGWTLLRLGRGEDALEAFRLAEQYAPDDTARARAQICEGDVLTTLGRTEGAMRRYRETLAAYSNSTACVRLAQVIKSREAETRGRASFRAYHFAEARRHFAEAANGDSRCATRMAFYEVLCLYGEGKDAEALAKVKAVLKATDDPKTATEATEWLAKFAYSRGDWPMASKYFQAAAKRKAESPQGGDLLVWAARAELAEGNSDKAIELSSQAAERYPQQLAKVRALLVQGEALIARSRFGEAVIVLERALSLNQLNSAERLRALTLKADALYSIGADNPARYLSALDAYRAIRFGEELSPDARVALSFKIARVLEKLKRTEEAMDQYYSQVVHAYVEGAAKGEYFGDEARAAFSRAVLRLADEFEGRGRNAQAVNVLEHLADSGLPAAEEARRRIRRLLEKGRFL